MGGLFVCLAATAGVHFVVIMRFVIEVKDEGTVLLKHFQLLFLLNPQITFTLYLEFKLLPLSFGIFSSELFLILLLLALSASLFLAHFRLSLLLII